MPSFAPFPALRYAPDIDASAVAAPPYDVIDEDARARLEAAHPCNAVRLILPRDDAAPGDRYERAAADLAAWQREGVLAGDPQPCLYAYRMRYRRPDGAPGETLGVLGALGLPPGGPGTGDVLPHERTLPRAKSDRLALLRATRANLDPIWALSLASGLNALLDFDRPAWSCADADGVEHELAVIDDAARIAAIGAAIATRPAVLADGHHRFETACAYREEVAASGGDATGADAILALVVELADEQLCIQPINRLLDVPDGSDVRSRLAPYFDIFPAADGGQDPVASLRARMADEQGLGLVDGDGMALLAPTDAARAAAARSWPASVAGADAAIAEAALAIALPGASATYRDDAQTCAELVRAGAHDAALLVRPVSVAQTRAAAEAGDRMPQKTTFFWPKPRTGAVFRLLDR